MPGERLPERLDLGADVRLRCRSGSLPDCISSLPPQRAPNARRPAGPRGLTGRRHVWAWMPLRLFIRGRTSRGCRDWWRHWRPASLTSPLPTGSSRSRPGSRRRCSAPRSSWPGWGRATAWPPRTRSRTAWAAGSRSWSPVVLFPAGPEWSLAGLGRRRQRQRHPGGPCPPSGSGSRDSSGLRPC